LAETVVGQRLAVTEYPWISKGDEIGYRIEEVTEEARLAFLQTREEEESHPERYPEWFARLGVKRENWSVVYERNAEIGEVDWASAVIAKNPSLLSKLRRGFGGLRRQRLRLLRKQETGDELDLDAALMVMADIRNGKAPDPRVLLHSWPDYDRGFALSLLLDLSELMNRLDTFTGRPMLELSRELALLFAVAAIDLGLEVSLAGFQSQGRHLVDYQIAKRFEEPFDAVAKSRLAGFKGRYSTRMGTAIRHATKSLLGRGTHNRAIVIVTDGEPSDIDVFDPDHLLLDARDAVIEARRRRVQMFCVNIDPHADRYAKVVFGENRFLVLESLRNLPRLLPQLFKYLGGC